MNVPDFKRSPEEFNNLMNSDSSYRSNIYKALKANLPEFTKTPDEFNAAIVPQVDYNKIVSDTRSLQNEQDVYTAAQKGMKEQAMSAPGGVVPVNNEPTQADIERSSKLNGNIKSNAKRILQ